MDQQPANEYLAAVNNIKLHYLDHGGNKPVLIMLHGLTANAHAFDGLMAAGLGDTLRVISPDLRGNGLSDEPAFRYTVEDHAEDILGLIKHIGQEKVYLAGHSYGGYVAFYIAANYPEVVEKLVILDAATSMNPRAPEMLAKAISRLDIVYKDFDDYIAHVKQAPYIDFWAPEMLSYYRADVMDLPEGGVKPYCNLMTIRDKSMGLAALDWADIITWIAQPTILINALDNYTMDEPLLPDLIAKETVAIMKDAKYAGVDGNHLTMLYGKGAAEIVKDIKNFLV